jgi:hypothetical protein
MTPTFLIPQEIIEYIVDELHGHILTLKSCALVCHSFLHICRKYLFSTIHLLSNTHSRRLHERVLKETPEIALYIRELFVYGDSSEHYDTDDDAVAAWLAKDAALLRTIQLADRLRLLSLNEHGPPIFWNFAFTKELQSAFLARFQSPHLVVLKIHRVHALPVSTLLGLTQLKGLSVTVENFDKQSWSGPVSPLTQLKALELYSTRPIPIPMKIPFPPMPNLYLLSIHDDGFTWSIARQVIRSCADSIKSVVFNHRARVQCECIDLSVAAMKPISSRRNSYIDTPGVNPESAFALLLVDHQNRFTTQRHLSLLQQDLEQLDHYSLSEGVHHCVEI